MHPPSLEVSDPELARWLADLNIRIWEPVVYRDKFGTREGREEKGKLSKGQWAKVREVMASGNVILTLHDYGGFVLHLSMWTYPVSDFEEEPVCLLTVSDKHLKGVGSGLNTPTEDEGLWGIVRPFTHSDANVAAVRTFLPDHAIKERSRYNY